MNFPRALEMPPFLGGTEAIMGDDEHILSTLYDQHASALYCFVMSLTRNEVMTEDILQDIFCRIAREPRRVAHVSNLRSYLIRWAHRLVIEVARKQTRADACHQAIAEISIFAESDDPDQATLRAAMQSALARLPSDQRAVVHLKVWEDLTFQEIADALGISPHTAASRYRYGLDKLQSALRPIYEEIF